MLFPTHSRERRVVWRAPLVVAALLAAACWLPAGNASAHRARARGARRCPNENTRVGKASRQALKRAVLCLVNHERTERGLPPLRESRRLDRSAQGWTNAMVASGSFSHGSDPAARVAAAGFAAREVGENIATGYRTPRSVVAAWMASTGHCQNILNPSYSHVGTGIVYRVVGYNEPGATWTQDFALAAHRRAPSGNWGPANHCPY